MDALAAIVLGVGAGVVAGLLGVGGGILFVPALTLALGLSQVDAETTSLLAIVPVSALGTYRQHGYGNVNLREGLLIGALGAGGVAAGVALANALPQHVLKLGFAGLMVFVALRLLRASRREPRSGDGDRPVVAGKDAGR